MSSKRYRAAAQLIEVGKAYPLEEAFDLVSKTATTKFEGSVEVHVR